MADIRQEIPVRSFAISAYVVRIEDGRGQYLLLKRASAYLHASWQQVSGRIEAGETGWQAALREIREETGLTPARFYSADVTEVFYEHHQNCINVNPVFVAFVDADAAVVLSPDEHDEFRWVTPDQAAALVAFDTQVTTIQHIEKRFVRQPPNEFLRIAVA
jgi:dATP pyrophosphohydrolase